MVARHSEEVTTPARAADAVTRSIEAQIVAGELPVNSPLPTERELMQQFEASRTVVREAIAALASRGLLECKPRYRPIVRKPDFTMALQTVGDTVCHLLSEPGGIKNLYDSRVFLERALVREAATSGHREHLQALRSALQANEAAIDDLDGFYATDVAFHAALYQVPCNPIFSALQQVYTDWLSPHWEKMPRSQGRNLVNYKSHERIFKAIEERDPDAAEQALLSHLNAAWEYVQVTFDQPDAVERTDDILQ